MKHEREDNTDAGPASKRLRVEESNQQGQAQRLTPNDALGYLRAVKEMFRDNKGKYDEFLVVMKDFKAQRIDTDGVIVRVKELFKGHRDLILGFNTFLPKGYEITLEEGPKRQPVEFHQAINYVNKIKFRFQHDETVYKAFLEILNMYRKGSKSISEVYKEVSIIFKEHADLLEEFACFLPDTNGYVKPHSKVQDDSILPHKPQLERAIKRETVEALPEDECSSERPDTHNPGAIKSNKDQHKKLQTEAHGTERKHKTNPEDQQPNKCKSTRIANDVNCTLESDKGDPCVGNSASCLSAEKKLLKSVQKQHGFFELVKDTLQNAETYQEFLKCLKLYSEEIITRERLNYLVDKMFLKFPDLIKGFNDFLRHCELNDGYLANIVHKSDGSNLVAKEWKWDKDAVDKNKGDAGQGMEKKKETDKNPLRISNTTSGNKYMMKPISELDLTECKQCTPSYRLLPENYPIPKVSCRTAVGNIVLNDSWVSVTSGSEEAPFKHMRKNQYEESLFRCEDDRFELDMLVESTGVTTRRLEELMKRMQDENIKEQISIDEYLTAIQLRCIERIYGDHGLDVLELLRKNLTVALPIVMNRLKQKQDEWLKCRADMNKVWAEVYAKNYHKSLDHRSFHFKQQDKKRLCAKVLLAEIKEANGKNRKGDEFILSLAAGNSRPFIPDLTLQYPDHCMNEDLYEIVKHSADEMCTTSEQADKIMSLWKQFLEPIFGASYHKENTSRRVMMKPARSQGFVSTNSDAKVDRDGRKVVRTTGDNPKNSQTGITSRTALNVSEIKREAEKRLPVPPIKADSVSIDNSIPDISKNGCSGKIEREEGELSPSQDAEENHPGVDGSEDSLHPPSLENVSAVKVALSQDCLSSEEEKGAADSGDLIEDEDGSLQRISGSFEPGNDRRISRCKALVLHNPPVSSSLAAEDCKLFYGNDNIYLLFRLHQALHERIHAAKIYAAATEEKMKTSKDIPSPELYHKFLQALYELLDGTADNAKFEDVCRSIIGTQSYLMFTMDKLIFKLVKQLQAIASDESASKLLMLHAYQKSHAHGLVDSIYHANACMVLHDENVYRFERRLKPTSQLFIQLMDVGPERSDVFANAVETSFAKYLDKFLCKEPLHREDRPPIYLKRNMVCYNLNYEQNELVNALKNVDIVNGLEYKISCNTYTVSYVLDTEDFLHRKKRKRRVGISARIHVTRFQRWLDRHINL